MTIERAEDEEAVIGLDDHFTTPYTAYDVLHHLIHEYGTESVEEGLAKAESEEKDGVAIQVPPVPISLQLLKDALKRFKETHSPEELKEAAKGAQSYFGGGLGGLLKAMGAVEIELTGPEEPQADPDPGKKLH